MQWSQGNYCTLNIDDCVIVIKSGLSATNLHKELRQPYKIIFYILQHRFDHIDEKDIPKLPSSICIETQEKENKLWAKFTLDRSCILFVGQFVGNQIFDALGNITCKSCFKIISVELPQSNHFKAHYPVIL